MRDNGEPISRGQLDRGAAEIWTLRDSLFVVALIGGAVLIDGILAILLIEFFQSMGWWPVPASEGTQDATIELSARLRPRAALTGSIASS